MTLSARAKLIELLPELAQMGLLCQLVEFAKLSKELQERNYCGQVVFHVGDGSMKGYDLPPKHRVRW